LDVCKGGDMKRNLNIANNGLECGIVCSPGCFYNIKGEKVLLPNIYCEDCGEELIVIPMIDSYGNIFVKVYECDTSKKLRWELYDRLDKLSV
jgi:hypothetical protein